MGTISEKLAYMVESKEQMRRAIGEMGVSIPENTPFRQYAGKIKEITNDATATAANILSGETAYVKGVKLTGTMPSKGAQTYTPGRENQTISSGRYLSGAQTIKGDANLLPENIVSGKSIFGVEGSASSKGVAVFNGQSASLNIGNYDTSSVSFSIGKNDKYDGWNAYICNISAQMYGTFMSWHTDFEFSNVYWDSKSGKVTATLIHTDQGFEMDSLRATIILVEP